MRDVTPARHRDDLRALSAEVSPLAGGSELFAAPQAHLTGLVDLMTLGWASLVVDDDVDDDDNDGPEPGGLEIGATCTIAELSRMPARPGWSAHPLFLECCTALFGSFKVWNTATVGGNLCASLPAGPMTALAVALDADVLIWRRDGRDELLSAREFVTGNMTNVLGVGDVLRSIQVPASSLGARTAFRKIALSPLGRSGAMLIGRLDRDGGFVLTVTAATLRPVQLRYPALPAATDLRRDLDAIDAWFTDAHGAADWRRAVSLLLGEEIRAELQQGTHQQGTLRQKSDRS